MGLPAQFGAYVLLERLGEGAQGDVHLARSVSGPPLPVVIKRLAPHHAAHPDFVRRFRHEAMIATALDSPHVAKVLDVGRVGERLYMVMEYVAGWPLSKVIGDLKRSEDRPSLASLLEVVCGALDGLSALHTALAPDGSELRIVHRDIAPKNLMLSEDGIAKVIDLGLGKSERQDWVTATGVVMGTPGYMAPEQARADAVDRRTDLFAMGVVLFELLTLQRYIPPRPIALMLRDALRSHFRPPSSVRADVPLALDDVVRRAVELDPAARYQSASEFAAELRLALSGLDRAPAASLLTQLAWDEFAATRAQVTRLLTTTHPLDRDEVQKGEVFSARTINQRPSPIAPSLPPTRAVSRAPERRPSRVPTWLAVVGCTALVAAGWFGRVLTEPKQAPQAPPPAVAQTADPSVRAVALPAAEPSEEKIEKAKPPARSTPRRSVRPPEVPPPPPPAAKIETPIVPVAARSREAQVKDLIREARALKARAGPLGAEVDSLVAELNLHLGSPRFHDEEARTKELAERVRALRVKISDAD